MKLSIAFLTAVALTGCTELNSSPSEADLVMEGNETQISEQLNVCALAPPDAQVVASNTINSESVSYRDSRSSYDITLSRSLDDTKRATGSMVDIGGPLDVLVFGTLAGENSGAYLIAFDNLRAPNSRAIGSVEINADSLAGVDAMFTFLSTWHNCDGSPVER